MVDNIQEYLNIRVLFEYKLQCQISIGKSMLTGNNLILGSIWGTGITRICSNSVRFKSNKIR